jgi:hypothetical protein
MPSLRPPEGVLTSGADRPLIRKADDLTCLVRRHQSGDERALLSADRAAPATIEDHLRNGLINPRDSPAHHRLTIEATFALWLSRADGSEGHPWWVMSGG